MLTERVPEKPQASTYDLRREIAKLGLHFKGEPRTTTRNDFLYSLLENPNDIVSGQVSITDINSALKNTCNATIPAYLLDSFIPTELKWYGFANETFSGLFFAGFLNDSEARTELDLNKACTTIQLSTELDLRSKTTVPDSIKISGIVNSGGYIPRIIAAEYQTSAPFQLRTLGISVGRTELVTDQATRFPVAPSTSVAYAHVKYPGFISQKMVNMAEDGKIRNVYPNTNELIVLLASDFGTLLEKAKYSIGIQPSAKWLEEARELLHVNFKNVDYNPTDISVPWKLNSY